MLASHPNARQQQSRTGTPLCLWLRPRAVRSETKVSRPDRRRQSKGHQVTPCWPIPGIAQRPRGVEPGGKRGYVRRHVPLTNRSTALVERWQGWPVKWPQASRPRPSRTGALGMGIPLLPCKMPLAPFIDTRSHLHGIARRSIKCYIYVKH